MAATEIIPVIDLGPYLAGAPEQLTARWRTSVCADRDRLLFHRQSRRAFRQIREVFSTSRALSRACRSKRSWRSSSTTQCRLPAMMGDTLRTSTVETVTSPTSTKRCFGGARPAERSSGRAAGRRFRSANRWPSGCRASRRHRGLLRHDGAAAAEDVRLYAGALDLPAEYFDQPFKEPQYKLRMTHYPHQAGRRTTSSGLLRTRIPDFLTLLAPNDVPGLSSVHKAAKWIDAPAILRLMW